jgi:hypothetical protein
MKVLYIDIVSTLSGMRTRVLYIDIVSTLSGMRTKVLYIDIVSTLSGMRTRVLYIDIVSTPIRYHYIIYKDLCNIFLFSQIQTLISVVL